MTDTVDRRPGKKRAAVDVAGLLRATGELCQRLDRADLVAAIARAAQRLGAADVTVGVVGEYKSGKSSLVNGLVGEPVSPVDDDLATCTVLAIGYAPEPRARVRRLLSDEIVTEEIDPHDLGAMVCEQGNPDNVLGVQLAEVLVPADLLEAGMVLVDTPGVGSLSAGARIAATGFLREADALIFVTDAASEFSRPEMDFLEMAVRECPAVIVVLTKIDLHSHWRRIRDLNRMHLAQAGLDLPLVVSSSRLRWEALRRDDCDLEAESGFGSLLEAVERHVLYPRVKLQARHALRECRRVTSELDHSLAAAAVALADPRGETLGRLRRAQEELAQLRTEGGRWQVMLNDGMADLRAETGSAVRAATAELLQSAEKTIDGSGPIDSWASFTESLQEQTAVAAQTLIGETLERANLLADRIGELLQDEVPSLPTPDSSFDAGLRLDDLKTRQGGTVATGFSAVRGVQGGAFMAVFLAGQFGLTAGAPIALGVGAVYAVRQLTTERKARLERHRSMAKTNVRKYLDQVRLQLATDLESFLRSRHRALRDHFTERILELSATFTAALDQARVAARQDADQRRSVIERLEKERRAVAQVAAQLDRCETDLLDGRPRSDPGPTQAGGPPSR